MLVNNVKQAALNCPAPAAFIIQVQLLSEENHWEDTFPFLAAPYK